jgi:hypothetical protein
MTRSNIRAMIRKRLGETTASFWSDPELNTWINDACRDIAFRAKCLKGTAYMSFINDVSEYALSTVIPNVLSINEFYYKQDGINYQKLESTSRTELDLVYSGWQGSDSGVPIKYWYDREEDIFALYPPPLITAVANIATSTTSLLIAVGSKTFTTQAGKQFAVGQFITAASAANLANYMQGDVVSYSGTTLVLNVTNIGGSGTYADWTLSGTLGDNYGRVFYTKSHIDMTADAEEPQLPANVQNAITDYVVAYGYEQRGWGDKANDAWQKYYSKIHDYQVERHREKEDDDIVMRNYRNI